VEKWHNFEMLDCELTQVGHKFDSIHANTRQDVRFTDVRGGWAWPTDLNPFYCVIIGQDFFDEKLYVDKSPSFTVIFEATDTGLDLDKRFNELNDISALYKCEWYADCSESHEPESSSWYDFMSAKSMRHGDLQAAPWADNFRLGVEYCKTLVRTRKLTIAKDTQIFSQLQRITDKDLADRDVKSRYYAIEALRHVVCGFKRDPASNPDINFNRRGIIGGEQSWLM
jgi:hypothetical protein